MSIVIDPELEAVCLPLAEDEYRVLESQIVRDGCLDPLKVWNRDGELVLLDGHHRFRVCSDHDIPFATTTVEIDSQDAAISWICGNQLGRRNLSDQQKSYLIGKRYELEKKLISNELGSNQYKEVDRHDDGQPTTAKRIAVETNVSPRTVERDAVFAQGVDVVREVSQTLADRILKPNHDEPRLTKYEVSSLTDLKVKDPIKFVEVVHDLEDAMISKDGGRFSKVVQGSVRPDEPTELDKRIAEEHNTRPDMVRYARKFGIPIERMPTIPELEERERMNSHKSCCNIWDGFYECGACGVKFELYGAKKQATLCPVCGQTVRRT